MKTAHHLTSFALSNLSCLPKHELGSSHSEGARARRKGDEKMSTRRTSRRLGARAPDTPMDDTDDAPATCAVCLEPMHEEGSTVALACSHTFHASCLEKLQKHGLEINKFKN